MKFVYADFMKMDRNGKLILNCSGTCRDLEEQEITLANGLRLAFYNDDIDESGNKDDLVVEGIVEFDDSNERWVARIDWDAIRNVSRLSSEERRRIGLKEK